MKILLKSIATGLIGLFVLGAAISFQPVPAILFALAAASVFPPVNSLLKGLAPRWAIYSATVLCFIAGAATLDTKKGVYGEPISEPTQAAAPAPLEAPDSIVPPCQLVITKLAERNSYFWFSVEKFDTNNPLCYRELELYAKDFASHRYGTVALSFFDSLPHFAVPADGRNYGGEHVMKKEILFYRRVGELEEVSFHKW